MSDRTIVTSFYQSGFIHRTMEGITFLESPGEEIDSSTKLISAMKVMRRMEIDSLS